MKRALSLPDYSAFLIELKERVLHARIAAGRVVNRELILLYWDIGRGIAEKQQGTGWGDAVVEKLAADLRAEFPDMRGFSANNLRLVRRFYSEYTSAPILEQLVQELDGPRGGSISGTTCSRKSQEGDSARAPGIICS